MKKILIVLSLILVFCGCTSTKVEEPYKTISGYDAYQMINSEKILIIDVRTKEEYNSGHLENAVNIPHTTIETEIFNVTKDFNQKIIIYCRSGGRVGEVGDESI